MSKWLLNSCVCIAGIKLSSYVILSIILSVKSESDEMQLM
jgi:hypothetical protein